MFSSRKTHEFTTKELGFCPGFPPKTWMPLVNSLTLTCTRYKLPPRVAAPFASQCHLQSLIFSYPSPLLSIVHLKQAHPTSAAPTFQTSGGGKWALIHCRSISGLNSLHASSTFLPATVTTKNVCRYCPVSPGSGTKPSPVEGHCCRIWGKALSAGDSAMNVPHEMSVFRKCTF